MSYDLSNIVANDGKPKGEFTLRCISAKIKKTRNNEDMFAIEYCIISDSFSNFRVYDNFMLEGKGAQYAMPKLAHLMDLIEVPRNAVSDSSPWLNKIINANLTTENDRTVIKKYSKVEVDDTFHTESF